MKKNQIEKMVWNEVTDQGADKVKIKIPLGVPEGVPNFIMRVFEIAPGGNTPRHTHSWEHEIYALSGKAVAFANGKDNEIGCGDALLIEPNEEHQFKNVSKEPFRFICLIPKPKV
jgi:quercetin dioxygenase-like cupin family protein